ncbi:hypothetical protein BDV30DRAFT_25072 [Aspergillus minisclerotigenes]|uniref:Secreted protein n=1 Tax=Aspergillus minisclerotigenes TaxID=656917 RepID=A0A5N6JFU5_9EURO|nr:hypothetical protein BDV30DRAFT_25072 [Aspergillus minisclerotigenes]
MRPRWGWTQQSGPITTCFHCMVHYAQFAAMLLHGVSCKVPRSCCKPPKPLNPRERLGYSYEFRWSLPKIAYSVKPRWVFQTNNVGNKMISRSVF